MKDFVFDISKHAAALGFFESAKIVTDENTTEIFFLIMQVFQLLLPHLRAI